MPFTANANRIFSNFLVSHLKLSTDDRRVTFRRKKKQKKEKPWWNC